MGSLESRFRRARVSSRSRTRSTRSRARGLTVVGLLGRDGGPLKTACDHVIVVPGTTADRIQEVHIKIVHLLIELIEKTLFGSMAV